MSVADQIEFIASKRKCAATEMKIGRGHNIYLKTWLSYINNCKNRTDLYEFMINRSIGIFDSECILTIANFFEFSGDYNPDLQYSRVPILDYRYCDKIF
jgi:hypothetical protein